MSKAVQEQVDQLFVTVKDLQSLEEIKPHCEKFNEWINTNTNYSIKSLGTVLSRAGFYKKFKSLPLEQGKNADSVPKHDANGNVTGYELKHYVLLLCGLDKKDWEERNETTRVSLRLDNGQEISPDEYLEVTGKLLESQDLHEVAVGLIAATGRRPHEILARAKFAAVEGQSYQVMFTGQGKKRGDQPVFAIATLYPASYVIERLNWLRKEPSTKALLTEVANENPTDVAAQNRAIDSRRNGSLNRVVRAYFGDKGDKAPILNFRHGEEQDNCKALRAAYLALATERDCQGSTGSKMLHAARSAGHFVKESPTDRDLQNLVTTLGYADYYTTKPVGFPDAPEKEKLFQIRAIPADFEYLKELQGEWQLPNQQSVVSRLIEHHKNRVDVAKLLQEAQRVTAQLEAEVKELRQSNNQLEQVNNQLDIANKQLQQEKAVMETTAQQPQTVTLNVTELDSWLEKKVIEVVNKVTHGGAIAPATTATPAKVAPIKEEIDWQAKTDAEVWGSKATLAAVEKIRRSYQAICLYNDTVATGDSDRLAITNQALRDLSGCNGLLVRDWIEQHKDEVISHNAKFGMENKKDPSNPASYANKGKDTDKILLLINEEFLSGEGFKAGRN
ncbi:protelomerase family protein [Nostoc sp. KVJ20]|uniref:protelomerase family protein n=1 Tax=Nostoc sp. KVJ20 TaxID=457944 RepID=UPI00083CAB05|nr:protelomerase family protein [Nostoc sp. KVJ20]